MPYYRNGKYVQAKIRDLSELDEKSHLAHLGHLAGRDVLSAGHNTMGKRDKLKQIAKGGGYWEDKPEAKEPAPAPSRTPSDEQSPWESLKSYAKRKLRK